MTQKQKIIVKYVRVICKILLGGSWRFAETPGWGEWQEDDNYFFGFSGEIYVQPGADGHSRADVGRYSRQWLDGCAERDCDLHFDAFYGSARCDSNGGGIQFPWRVCDDDAQRNRCADHL